MQLLDTNILIDYLKPVPDAVTLVDSLENPAVSIITQMELLVAATTTAKEQGILEFLKDFKVLPMNDAVVLEAARLKRHLKQTGAKKMQMPDLIIRATASVHGAIIYTLNKDDFPAGTGVIHPYTPVANTSPTLRQQAAAAQTAAASGANVTPITAAQQPGQNTGTDGSGTP